MALKRLQREFREAFLESPTEFAVICVDADMFHWRALVAGPSKSPYAGGIFELSLQFPADYPFKPPTVDVLTPMWHPHVHSDSRLCNCCFGGGVLDQWSPAFSVVKLMRIFIAHLADPSPSGACGMEWGLAPDENGSVARSWTEHHAMSGLLRSAARRGALWLAPELPRRGISVASFRRLDQRTLACLHAEVAEAIGTSRADRNTRHRIGHSALFTVGSDAIDRALGCIVPYAFRGDDWALEDTWRLVSSETRRRFYVAALCLRRLSLTAGVVRLMSLFLLEPSLA